MSDKRIISTLDRPNSYVGRSLSRAGAKQKFVSGELVEITQRAPQAAEFLAAAQ